MSFCSSPDRKTTFLPASGAGPDVGPSHTVCGPAYLITAAFASASTWASSARAIMLAPASRAIKRLDPAKSVLRTVMLVIVSPPPWYVPPFVDGERSGIGRLQVGAPGAAARADDEPGRQDHILRGAVRRSYPPEQQTGGLFAELARSDRDGRQGRPTVGGLFDIVEADHRAVAAGLQPLVGEPQQEAEGANIVVAEHGRGIARLAAQQRADGRRARFAGRQTADDRPDRQSIAGHRLPVADAAVAHRRGPPAAAHIGDALVPEADEVLGRERHAEAEIGADEVGLALPHAAQHLHDRQAVAMQPFDGVDIGALRRTEQQAIDPLLAHALDEAVLAGRRLRRIGQERNPPRAIERAVDSRRQLGVERVGDLADDEADRLRRARAQIGGAAIVDVAERIDGCLDARARRLRNQGAGAQNKRYGRRRDARMLRDLLERYARSHALVAALPANRLLDRYKRPTALFSAFSKLLVLFDLYRSKLRPNRTPVKRLRVECANLRCARRRAREAYCPSRSAFTNSDRPTCRSRRSRSACRIACTRRVLESMSWLTMM